MSEPYRLADKTISALNKTILRRFMIVRKLLAGSSFDELNVLNGMDALYEGLRKDNREALFELWMLRYLEVFADVKGKYAKKPDEDELDDLIEMHLAGLLDEPHPVTRYTYAAEVPRKRDRAKESVAAQSPMTERRYELDKAMRQWAQMTRWYAEFTSQDAEVQAYIDCGVERVKRHEEDDMKTCADCRAADGTIYDVRHIPPPPHPACRRWFTPA